MARPQRSSAKRAQARITDIAISTNPLMTTRNRRGESRGAAASITRGSDSSPHNGKDRLSLNVKVSSNKLRQATTVKSSALDDLDPSGEVLTGKRSRGGKKNYVVESDSDENEDGVDMALDEDEDEDDDDGAEEDLMELDAEGDDEDIDEEVDLVASRAAPIPASKAAPAPKKSALKSTAVPVTAKSSDSEMSDVEIDDEIDTTVHGDGPAGEDNDDEDDEEDDAEGEYDDEALPARPQSKKRTAPAGDEGDGDDDDDDDDEFEAGAETPDVSKMTKRQRARFEDEPQQHMKLSDEVQVKKHLTEEQQSMRRLEMTRRRRNLSAKRNEEVKMETINKLLKKQATKTTKKAAAAQAQIGDDQRLEPTETRANPMFVRWVNTRNGSRIGVPDELLQRSGGAIFADEDGNAAANQPPSGHRKKHGELLVTEVV